MTIEIKTPTFPESITEGTIAAWSKKLGDSVKRDDLIVEIETDKVVMEVLAEADGVISEIIKQEGDTVLSGELLGKLTAGAVSVAKETTAKETSLEIKTDAQTLINNQQDLAISPTARLLAADNNLDLTKIKGTGKGGLITKEDVQNAINNNAKDNSQNISQNSSAVEDLTITGERIEKRVPMTRLRARVAQRLVEAQSSMAMLTTFNEVNMRPIMELRNKYKDLFEKKHDGVRLGFMSFFVKAATEALRRQPAVNASIDGSDIVYHGYQDIGVAVSSDRGLVVPILRNAELMSIAQIESSIANFGKKARDGKLTLEELQGGTFTISNGGVFGSLLSTPIVNPPQTAILGMHKIQERPMAINGEVVILPMMYLALSYDHRLIDGKEAVTFLVTIKNLLEDPARLLLDV